MKSVPSSYHKVGVRARVGIRGRVTVRLTHPQAHTISIHTHTHTHTDECKTWVEIYNATSK